MFYFATMKANVAASLSISATGVSAALTPNSRSENLTTEQFVEVLQSIGTSATAIADGWITAAGWALFVNTDPTNFVVLSLNNDGTAPFAKLHPGQFALIPLATNTVYAKADTAAVGLQILAASV